jgi:thiamine pyrophosphate-dependent acetolactate synthase large subunit-like protein
MAETAADVLVEGIIDWGVDTVFSLPGDARSRFPRQTQ